MAGIFQPVASGTVTQANMKISAVNGTAFIDFTAATFNDKTPIITGTSTQANTRIATVATGALLELVGVDLSAHLGKYIKIKANGKTLGGYIGAAGGESLGSELITSWTNFTYETFDGSTPPNITSAINSSATAYANSNTVSGMSQNLYKLVSTVTLNSGSDPEIWRATAPVQLGVGTFTRYFTGTVTDTGIQYNNLTDTNYSAVVTFKKVLDLATTGAKIYATSALATQSWAANDGIDPNYSGGYTYEIYTPNPLPTKLGHLLKVKDSAGKVIQGFIKAAGSGETLGSELITNWVNSATYPWETYTEGSGTDLDELTSDATGYHLTNNADTIPALSLVKYSSDIVKSGAGTGIWSMGALDSGVQHIVGALTTGTKSGYVVANAAYTYNIIWGYNGIVSMSAKNNTLKIVTSPSTTGVTITSTKGGTTYNWAQKDAAFNYNAASGYSYEILRVLDAILLDTDSVLNADATIVMTAGSAAWSATGLDDSVYQDGKHIIHITDSNGVVAFGYYKSGGTGAVVNANSGATQNWIYIGGGFSTAGNFIRKVLFVGD